MDELLLECLSAEAPEEQEHAPVDERFHVVEGEGGSLALDGAELVGRGPGMTGEGKDGCTTVGFLEADDGLLAQFVGFANVLLFGLQLLRRGQGVGQVALGHHGAVGGIAAIGHESVVERSKAHGGMDG